MTTPSAELVRRAIAREPDAVLALVRLLSPAIQVRVTRALSRSRTVRAQGRSRIQEVEDLTQEVFLALFEDDARALRAFDPTRGASLTTFIGMVAEHQLATILRSGRRAPWRETETASELDFERLPSASGGQMESAITSREFFAVLLERLRSELTPRGLELFYALFVEEQPIDSVCKTMGMTPDAVYAWKSRLSKLVRKLARELDDNNGVQGEGNNDAGPSEMAPGDRKAQGGAIP